MAALLAFCLLGCSDAGIQPDERVVFFPTTARRAADGKAWEVPVHGWIFEEEEGSLRRSAALALLKNAMRIDGTADGETFAKRARAFIVDDERGEKLAVRIGGATREVGESEVNGHFMSTLRVEREEAGRLLLDGPGGGVIRFRAVTLEGDKRVFEGEARLVDETGLSVISDVDDTIKVSDVRDTKALLRNTFLHEFEAVPGMAPLYASWAKRGAAFHYVTASPWQLYEPLSEFQERSGFPKGEFHMKRFRWKDSDFFQLFRDPRAHKVTAIEAILKRFPRHRVILVGDSGERDPEAYGEIARAHPSQVALILIRDVTLEGPDSERMKGAFRGVSAETWRVFRDPGDVPALDGAWFRGTP